MTFTLLDINSLGLNRKQNKFISVSKQYSDFADYFNICFVRFYIVKFNATNFTHPAIHGAFIQILNLISPINCKTHPTIQITDIRGGKNIRDQILVIN